MNSGPSALDAATGALTLREGRIDSALTRTRFLASALSEGAVAEGAGWRATYKLVPQPLGARTLAIELRFQGERLASYSLWDPDPRFGTSWDDWTVEKALAQRAVHSLWLRAQLGLPEEEDDELTCDFPWGSAWSTFDRKGGSSYIGVTFGGLDSDG